MKKVVIFLLAASVLTLAFAETATQKQTSSSEENASTVSEPVSGNWQDFVKYSILLALFFAPRPTLVVLWFFGGAFGMPFAWKESWTIFTAVGFVGAPYFLATQYIFEVLGVSQYGLYLAAIVGLAKQLALFGEPYFLRSLKQEFFNSIAGIATAYAAYGTLTWAFDFLTSWLISKGLSTFFAFQIVYFFNTLHCIQLFYFFLEQIHKRFGPKEEQSSSMPHVRPIPAGAAGTETPSSPVRAAQISSEKYQEEGKAYTRKNLELLKKYLEENPDAAANSSLERKDLLKKLDESIKSLISA